MRFSSPFLIRLCALGLVVGALGGGPRANAKIQFDVFPGYDNTVRSGGWYPIGIEVFNDGPGFDAEIVITPGQFGGQVQHVRLELPTNTRKRFVIPAFLASANFLNVEAKLYDSSGKLRDEPPVRRPTIAGWESVLLGSLPGSHAGLPAFPQVPDARVETLPQALRLTPEFFPENPLALEGLNAIYLNTARALELKQPQVEALLGWVHGGGHLIVAVDQPADVNATSWLRNLLPADVRDVANRTGAGLLDNWTGQGDFIRPGVDASPLRHGYEAPHRRGGGGGQAARSGRVSGDDPYSHLTPDRDLARAEVPTVGLRPMGGSVLVGNRESPWMVTATRGRGLVTLLAFNPEREPLKSWKNRPWFFARLCGVPGEALVKNTQNLYGGRSLDAVFGAMVETRQVRKLPVGMLLLLLVVYLVVIGPLDQWWLKKINRPMLTWITFPSYVALFSLLIYVIGFKLRAGQTEWNELHVVDVLPRGDGAVLRGRTFASVYSPANENYRLAADLANSTVRPEFTGLFGGGPGQGRTSVTFGSKNGFTAEIYVPVWTSQMCVSDWQDSMSAPLKASQVETGDGFELTVENQTGKAFSAMWVVHAGVVYELGKVGGGATEKFVRGGAQGSQGQPLRQWITRFDGPFRDASGAREQVLGGNERTHLDDWPTSSVAASFPGLLDLAEGGMRDYVFPAGCDLTPLADRGETILFAWLPNETLVPTLNKFTALRTQKGTLLRLVVPPATR